MNEIPFLIHSNLELNNIHFFLCQLVLTLQDLRFQSHYQRALYTLINAFLATFAQVLCNHVHMPLHRSLCFLCNPTCYSVVFKYESIYTCKVIIGFGIGK